ncbi:MAG: DUF4386 domain-containing protein [Saprospiraceae bacterium]
MQVLSFKNSTVKYARVTGLMYLAIIFCGLFSGLFVREALVDFTNPALTAENILNNLFLFKMGFVSDLIMIVCDIVVALTFYVLLKPASKNLALMAAFFRLVQASIIALNMLHHFEPVLMLDGSIPFNANSSEQLFEMVLFSLKSHEYGYLISGVFFGMSCLILSYLFKKSDLFPNWLAYLLAVGAMTYLGDCLVNFLFPEYAAFSEMMLLFTAVLAEFTITLYLLFKKF